LGVVKLTSCEDKEGAVPDNDGKVHVASARFKSIPQVDVPKGRDGKHKPIVLELIEALQDLKPGTALKIALSELPDSKENIRAALSRATRQQHMDIATSSDEQHLYIWKVDQ
jgi:TusA-related sulfurtransferase